MLSNKGTFMIDGIEFTPSSLKVNFESLATDDSGRTADGVMHINYIFSKIRKLEIAMPPCSAAEASALLSKVQGRVYNITYFDPLANAEITIEVYTSGSSGSCYSGVVRNGLYTGITFNAIQTGGEE